MAFPLVVFVREGQEPNGTKYLLVYEDPQEAIEEDGPTVVATYKFVGKRKLMKLLHEIKRKKR